MRVRHRLLQPGKYVSHKNNHFEGLQIWEDGSCIVRPTRKKHVGTVCDFHPELLQSYNAIFQLVSLTTLPEVPGTEKTVAVTDDFEGGSFPRTPSGGSLLSMEADMVAPTSQIATPSVLAAWLVSTDGFSECFLPISAEGSCTLQGFLSAAEAAEWFLRVAAPFLPAPWEAYLTSLPAQIQAEALLACCFSPACERFARPRLYLYALFTFLRVQAAISEFREDVMSLYKYVWPKACLKEALLRMGFVFQTRYQSLDSIEAVNHEGYNTNQCVWILWPQENLEFPGTYIVHFGNVFSAVKGGAHVAVWQCGQAYAIVFTARIRSLCGLPNVHVYRMMQMKTAETDVEGGSSNVPSVCIERACTGERICDMRVSDGPLLHQIRVAISDARMCAYFRIAAVCNGGLLQAKHSWTDAGCPNVVQVVLRPETTDHSSAFFAAIRAGNDDLLCSLLEKGQSPMTLWTDGERNALVYACCYGKSASVATTLIQAGASVTACFQGHPVLHYCLIAGWVDVAEKMLARGARLSSCDDAGKTCLHQTAWFNKPLCVAWLLQRGLDPLVEDLSGDTPLSLAKDSSPCTALILESCWNRIAWKHLLVRFLEEVRESVDKCDMMALFLVNQSLSKQMRYFVGVFEEDVAGGAAGSAEVYVDVLETIWLQSLWWMVPLQTLCDLRCSNRKLSCALARLENVWLQHEAEILETPLRNLVCNGLRAPQTSRTVRPRLRWDFSRSQRTEEMWLFDATPLQMAGATLAQWIECNPGNQDVVKYLAQNARQAGRRIQITHESEAQQQFVELTEHVFQFDFGPMRAWVSFLDTQAVRVSDEEWESEESDFEGGAAHVAGGAAEVAFCETSPEEDDRALILQERWLKQILARTKVLELRGRQARCGLVWLAHRSCLYGRARIAACEELSATRFALLRSEHGVLQGPPPYKRTWGLWLEDVLLLKKPVKFWKRWGAIGWARVRFSKQTTSQQQLGSGPQKLEDDPRENHATEVRGGLCNIGNSCFMNSVLQLIYAVPLLMRSIMEHRRAVHCGDACLRCLLQQTQVSRAGNAPLERRATAFWLSTWRSRQCCIFCTMLAECDYGGGRVETIFIPQTEQK